MKEKSSNRTLRNRLIFCVVAVLWFVFDRIVKYFCVAHPEAFASHPGIEGVVELRLVHNYGAAWGSFSGMVSGLVIVSIILCAAIAIYAFFASREGSLLEMIGLALVFAGGIGNMVDRLVNGYVIDLISPLFIDFPTFNIADVGITCGIACVIIALAVRFFSQGKHARGDAR